MNLPTLRERSCVLLAHARRLRADAEAARARAAALRDMADRARSSMSVHREVARTAFKRREQH